MDLEKRFAEKQFSPEDAVALLGGLLKERLAGSICYVYRYRSHGRPTANHYLAVACFVHADKKRKDFPYGQAFIVSPDRGIVYSSDLFDCADEYFEKKFFEAARFARFRVGERPICCGQYMNLTERRYRKGSCYWQCAVDPQNRSHDKAFDDLRQKIPAEYGTKLKERRYSRRRGKRRASNLASISAIPMPTRVAEYQRVFVF